MTRRTMTAIAIAMGGLVLTGTPYVSAKAQSGDALAHAERACIDYGVKPRSVGYNTCVERAAWAFDRGAPEAAYHQVVTVRNAYDSCQASGLDPYSLGYRACVTNQIDRSRAVQAYRTDEPPPPRPHPAVSYDRYGRGYDRDGNMLDRYGYVIQYAQ